jgi:hypothetical protein
MHRVSIKNEKRKKTEKTTRRTKRKRKTEITKRHSKAASTFGSFAKSFSKTFLITTIAIKQNGHFIREMHSLRKKLCAASFIWDLPDLEMNTYAYKNVRLV